MYLLEKEFLAKYKMIEDVFEYKGFDLEPSQIETYTYFENSFQKLFYDYSSLFHIKNCCFYIKSDNTCNAFAKKSKGYNIIGITNGYPILLKYKINKKHFKNIVLVGVIKSQSISEAYVELYEDQDFDFSKFVLDCSIKFTFNHEFQHIMQINSDQYNGRDYTMQENCIDEKYDIKRHAWEFDADRMASYEVLKYAFGVHRNLKVKSDERLICLLFIACASIFITKCLFYFGVANQLNTSLKILKSEFYTKEKSHPHPLVRCMNIIEYYFDNITTDLPRLKIDAQDLLNNCLGIVKLYFNSLIPDDDIINDLFTDLRNHHEDINNYNQELYDYAIHDESIRKLLLIRNIKVD